METITKWRWAYRQSHLIVDIILFGFVLFQIEAFHGTFNNDVFRVTLLGRQWERDEHETMVERQQREMNGYIAQWKKDGKYGLGKE